LGQLPVQRRRLLVGARGTEPAQGAELLRRLAPAPLTHLKSITHRPLLCSLSSMRPERVLELARNAGGTISSAELVAGGARWEDLYGLRDRGALVEISRGIYRVADAAATAGDTVARRVRTATTDGMPDGLIYKACGNRRS
jgi:hypothetical protein